MHRTEMVHTCTLAPPVAPVLGYGERCAHPAKVRAAAGAVISSQVGIDNKRLGYNMSSPICSPLVAQSGTYHPAPD
eukprot:825846-Pyramimonas_sp.AAC.1